MCLYACIYPVNPELAEPQERQAWESLSFCDEHNREIRQIFP